MIWANVYKRRKWCHKWSHSCSVTSSNCFVRLQSCEKAMGWCTAQCKILLLCGKQSSRNFELAWLKKKKEKHFGCLATFWFGTLVMLFRATRCLAGDENTPRWMVHRYEAYTCKFTVFEIFRDLSCMYCMSALSLCIESTNSMIAVVCVHLNCFMLSSLPCFYAFCWSAIRIYILLHFNVFLFMSLFIADACLS